MSYSRWLNSTFYTYWCATDAKNKNDEVFICHTDIYKCHKIKYIECKRMVENLIAIKGKINENRRLTQVNLGASIQVDGTFQFTKEK